MASGACLLNYSWLSSSYDGAMFSAWLRSSLSWHSCSCNWGSLDLVMSVIPVGLRFYYRGRCSHMLQVPSVHVICFHACWLLMFTVVLAWGATTLPRPRVADTCAKNLKSLVVILVVGLCLGRFIYGVVCFVGASCRRGNFFLSN